jgi:hypothetical protein
LALLCVAVGVSAETSVASSNGRVLGIGVGTFVVAVAAVMAIAVCIGARGTTNWKYVLNFRAPVIPQR